jgi:hypothetical protein
MTNIIPSGIIDENIELFSTTNDGPPQRCRCFDLPLKFMETLEGNAQNPSTIIALKLAGFKTREQQLEKFSECRFGFDLTADFKDGKLSDANTNVALEANAQWKELFADFQGKGHIITPLIFT